MIRLPAPLESASAAALVAAALALPAPLAAQDQSGTFSLPEATPAPSPAPAGPNDERAGVAVPPRAVPSAVPSAAPSAVPDALPTSIIDVPPSPSPAPTAVPRQSPNGLASPSAENTPAPASPAPAPSAGASVAPLPLPPAGPQTLPSAPVPATDPSLAVGEPIALPDWWPLAAGGLAALGLLGGAALMWRRRQPKVLRLAAPAAVSDTAAPAADLPRLDLTLEITGATRSVMMFTLQYRLAIANRSDRAVTDLGLAVHLACARASASPGAHAAAGGGNAPSPGTAQALATIARIGPHQARSITGEVQLPLSAVQPLRQGKTPLFVPLVHVTMEGEGQRAMTRSFVIGTPSASGAGRLHPILLDQPPGGVAGLVAQSIVMPPVSAAA